MCVARLVEGEITGASKPIQFLDECVLARHATGKSPDMMVTPEDGSAKPVVANSTGSPAPYQAAGISGMANY